MRQLGKIIQLQVQRSSLKRGVKPACYYDPAPIQVVESLLLVPEGVIGITDEGEHIVDIHNSGHPQSKSRGDNGISLGFTSHYRAMRARFGEHLQDGCAGENILVAVDEELSLDALGTRVAIQDQEGGRWLYLDGLSVAAPCLEFSRFALNEWEPAPAEIIRETLIFLHHGRRGFYASIADAAPFALRVGDSVWVEA